MSLSAWTRLWKSWRKPRSLSPQDRGDRARNAGDWWRAAEYYAAHVRAHPADFGIWVQLGHSLKEADRRDEALSAYLSALALRGRDADLLLQLGHFHARNHEHRVALDYYRQSLAADGNADADAGIAAMLAAIDVDLIRNSPLFDARWYADVHADVRDNGRDPAEHYLLVGGNEGKDPSPFFCTAEYLRTNDVVRAAGRNPLLHYITEGESQGILLSAALTAEERQQAVRIARHPLFEAEHHIAMFPDAARYRIPAEHYLVASRSQTIDPGPGFSASWYGRTQYDVSSSGMAPFLHYVLIGEAEGRLPMPARPNFATLRLPSPAMVGASALADAPRPDLPEVQFAEIEATGTSLFMGGAVLGKRGKRSSALQALSLFARAHAITSPVRATATAQPSDKWILGAPSVGFVDGWMDEGSTFRFRLEKLDAVPVRIRAYQIAAGTLHLCGETLGASDPFFLDVRCLNPFLPILFVLTDSAGTIIHTALAPFPSLLRGAPHHAEAAASGADDRFSEVRSLSAQYLDALIDRPRRASALTLHVDARTSIGTEAIFDFAAREWLTDFLGVAIELATDDDRPGPSGTGMTLSLPSDCLPTINISVGAQTPTGYGGPASGHLLVANRVDGAPLYEVAIPQPAINGLDDTPSLSRLPRLSGAGNNVAAGGALAIRFIGPQESAIQFLSAANDSLPRTATAPSGRLTVAIAYRSADALKRLALSLSQQTMAAQFDLVIMADKACDEDGRAAALAAAALYFPDNHSIADDYGTVAGTDVLLIDDTVILSQPGTVATLWTAASNDRTASISCLHFDQATPSSTVLSAAGFFVDAANAEGGSLVTPDVDILPQSLYPIACPPFALALIPRAVWDDIARQCMFRPAGQRAAAFAVASLSAGLRHLCTSHVAAYVPKPLSSSDAGAIAGDDDVDWRSIAENAPRLRILTP